MRLFPFDYLLTLYESPVNRLATVATQRAWQYVTQRSLFVSAVQPSLQLVCILFCILGVQSYNKSFPLLSSDILTVVYVLFFVNLANIARSLHQWYQNIMGKAKDISPRKIAEIKTLLLNTDHSNRKIASISKVSRATVDRIKNKLDANLDLTPRRKQKCGRKKITTPRDERKIRDIVSTNRKQPRRILTKIMQESGINISPMTARRRIKDLGFSTCRPAKKPLLTPAMKKKRLQWAKDHKDWTMDDWNQVCFSDESTVQILMDRSEFVRRRPGEKYKADCIVRTVKHPLSIMVWSIISSQGTGRLYIVEGTMRQDQYLRVLQTRMLPQVQEWFPNKSFTFMHDSAPCHKAKTVTKFLADNQIKVLDWPGNSPDLNPIENLWKLMKKEISNEIITTKRQLIERLIAVWHRTETIQQNCQKCIESMPRRCQTVIAAKGDTTKY